MQIDMFNSTAPEVKSQLHFKPLYDWQEKLADIERKQQQADFVSIFNPASNVVTYRSGSSSRADVQGYIKAGAPIGICILDASSPVRRIIADYVSDGGMVFIDSGAFRVFRKRLKDPSTPAIDFDKVFAYYHDVINACTNTDGLIVVAPDEVGQQQTSYELLEAYIEDITQIHEAGVSIMVPLQKGELSIAEHYARCRKLLGFDFIVGLPSNAEALSYEEVFTFLTEVQPTCVHFLGCAESALVHEAMHKSPLTDFSCDATKLRKHIGKGRLLTEMHNQQLDELYLKHIQGDYHREVTQSDFWDETEMLGDLVGFYESLLDADKKHFASFMNTSTKDIELFDSNDDLWAHLATCNYWPENQAGAFLDYHCRKSMSPKVRTCTVSTLAKMDVI